MCARTSGEYKEEVCGPKKEEEPQRQLLDAVLNQQPRFVRSRADVSENLREQQQSVSRDIKEEDLQRIKEEDEEFLHMKEEEQEEIIQVPSTSVPLKSRYEGQSEERLGAEPLSRNSSSDGDHCRGEKTETNDDDDEQPAGPANDVRGLFLALNLLAARTRLGLSVQVLFQGRLQAEAVHLLSMTA
ncbi:uncharacterized protein LOC133493287 isoform X4 [Syngnathoides biaculeatus]|uniref:uncharacterized protein LOC133493287 isoform X4 n=1 Tax=Syngnathoides biaculeatus TaxID=300417 RepID=UPI002ADDBD89|nr:uncharacterized protein LOC133493287 isoform X4 [Syngnathoides biaculeatus]